MDGSSIVSRETSASHAPVTVVPYEPTHLRRISLQPHQEHLAAFFDGSDQPEQIAALGWWTVIAQGEPVGCGGFVEPWAGRALAQAVLSHLARPHMLFLVREVRRRMDLHPARRIECTTVAGFRAGARFARACGFRVETPLMPMYLRGEDHTSWVYLKHNGILPILAV